MLKQAFGRVSSGSFDKAKTPPRRSPQEPPFGPPSRQGLTLQYESGDVVRHDDWSFGCKLVTVALSASAFQGRARRMLSGPCRWGPRASRPSPQD